MCSGRVIWAFSVTEVSWHWQVGVGWNILETPVAMRTQRGSCVFSRYSGFHRLIGTQEGSRTFQACEILCGILCFSAGGLFCAVVVNFYF